MSAKANLVHAELISRLESVEGLTVSSVAVSLTDALTKSKLPLAFVLWQNETSQTGSMKGPAAKTQEIVFAVRCYVRGPDPIDQMIELFAAIQNAVEEQMRLGAEGFEGWMRVTEKGMANWEDSHSQVGGHGAGVGEILISAQYRHARGGA